MEVPSSLSEASVVTIVYDSTAQTCLGAGDSSGAGDGGGTEVVTDDDGDDGVTMQEPVFLGPVITIILLDEAQNEVRQLPPGERFTFWLPVRESATGSQGAGCTPAGKTVTAPTCSFFNKEQQAWSTAGCATVTGIEPIPDGGGVEGVQCSCTHLTEFAVLETSRTLDEKCELSAAFFVYALCYLFVVCYCSATVWRLYSLLKKFPKSTQVGLKYTMKKHWVILLFSLLRLLSSLGYAGILYLPQALYILLALLSYFCMFHMFGSLISSWAFMYHFVMHVDKKAKMEKMLNRLTLLLVAFLVLCGLGLADVLGAFSSAMVLIGASAIAIVSLVIAVAFVYYAGALSATVGGMGRAASTQASSTGDHIQCTGIVCGCTFVAQSALWFLSTLNLYGEVDLREDSTTSLLLASFTLELLTVLAIIYMYSFPIEQYVQQARGS